MAHKKSTTDVQMENFYLDFYILSRCDFVVCTLTSNMGRLVYENFSVKFFNVSKRLVSMDLEYRLITGNGKDAYNT